MQPLAPARPPARPSPELTLALLQQQARGGQVVHDQSRHQTPQLGVIHLLLGEGAQPGGANPVSHHGGACSRCLGQCQEHVGGTLPAFLEASFVQPDTCCAAPWWAPAPGAAPVALQATPVEGVAD